MPYVEQSMSVENLDDLILNVKGGCRIYIDTLQTTKIQIRDIVHVSHGPSIEVAS